MTAKDIIREKFDNVEINGFDEWDVTRELNNIPENERSENGNSSEWLAFILIEGTDNNWGTYFGPYAVFDNISFPSQEMITEEVISYWEKRIYEVINPILKARYSGLVVDFKKKCSGDIRSIYIQSLIDIIKGNYPKSPSEGITKIKRLFRLAIESRKQDVIDEVKRDIYLYADTLAKNGNDIFVYLFKIVLDNYSHFTQQEITDYITRLEVRLGFLCDKNIDDVGKNRLEIFSIKEIVEVLAQYYNKINDRTNLCRVLDLLYDSFVIMIGHFSAMQKNAHWSMLYKIYTKYQFKEKAQKLLAELQNSSHNIIGEMGTIEIPLEIDKTKFEDCIKAMTSGSREDVLSKFISLFIPDKNRSKEHLLEISKQAFLFPIQIYDYKGRPTALISDDENDIEDRLVLYMSKSLEFEAVFIHNVIKENFKKGHFLKESIMDFLRKCPLFEEDRFEIIERGIEAYLDEDYITMIHLLIPQVENAIRNLVELLDESTLESKKSNNTLQLKTLDTLLREKSLLNISENFVYYMRVLYTDPRGWNLRNLVCHGLSPLKYFNPVTADRIFHSLICIGSITTK